MNNLEEKFQHILESAHIDPQLALFVRRKLIAAVKEDQLEKELKAYYAGGGCVEDLPLETRRGMA